LPVALAVQSDHAYAKMASHTQCMAAAIHLLHTAVAYALESSLRTALPWAWDALPWAWDAGAGNRTLADGRRGRSPRWLAAGFSSVVTEWRRDPLGLRGRSVAVGSKLNGADVIDSG
jgi:hypothetical protein